MRLKELLEDLSPSSLKLGRAWGYANYGPSFGQSGGHWGNVFIALAGARQHGLIHVAQALIRSLCCCFWPRGCRKMVEQINNVPMIALDGLGLKLGTWRPFLWRSFQVYDCYWHHGTNGKTSCSQFLSQMLDDCGIIGTLAGAGG